MPKVWRSAFWRGMLFALFLITHLAVIIGFYPQFVEQQGALLTLAKGLGKIFSQTAELSAKSQWGYMVSQQYFKFADTVGSFVAVLFAASAVAGESQRRTLEIWLAQPIPRWRQLLERWAASALSVAVPLILTSVAAPTIGDWVGVELSSSHATWLAAGLHASAFLLVIHGLTFLLSVRADGVVRPVLTMSLLTATAYAIYFVPVLNDWSPYAYADGSTFLAIEESGLDLGLIGKLLAVDGALLIAALRAFQRRLPS